MPAKIDSSQTSLNDDVMRVVSLHRKRVKLLAFEKSLKRQLQLNSDVSQVVDNLKYRFDGAVAIERRSETIMKSL